MMSSGGLIGREFRACQIVWLVICMSASHDVLGGLIEIPEISIDVDG
jgi:hypothetical protein